jgi:predicted nucleic acid-binding protein
MEYFALLAGCETFWSQDMRGGVALEALPRIVNPFRRHD